MKTIIRDALITFLVLALAPCVFAQWPLGREMMPAAKIEPGPTVTVNGRFQIFTSPNEKDDTFMLDTDTGRVWLLKKDKTSGDYVFKRIRVEEVDPTTKKDTEEKKTEEKKD
jgi:hypothetical protein